MVNFIGARHAIYGSIKVTMCDESKAHDLIRKTRVGGAELTREYESKVLYLYPRSESELKKFISLARKSMSDNDQIAYSGAHVSKIINIYEHNRIDKLNAYDGVPVDDKEPFKGLSTPKLMRLFEKIIKMTNGQTIKN